MYTNGIGEFFKLFFIMIPLSILGFWKIIDIVIWLIQNIKISIG